MNWKQAYDILADVLGVSKDALDLAFSVGGRNMDTAKFILYYYTGWKDFNEWLEDTEGV